SSVRFEAFGTTHANVIALAIDQRHNDRLLAGRGGSVAMQICASLAANEGFVDFDNATILTKQRSQWVNGHCEADAVGQEPRGLVGDSEFAPDLVATDALLTAAQQMNGEEPFPERNRRILEDRADTNRKLLAAGIALPQPENRLALRVPLTRPCPLR